MSSSSLFVPTYGPNKDKDGATTVASVGSAAATETIRAKRRVLPPTTAQAPQAKRSLLPSMVFNGKIEYVQTVRAAENSGREIEAARPAVLGFDIEWQVSFVQGTVPRRTATLQLCAPNEPTATKMPPPSSSTDNESPDTEKLATEQAADVEETANNRRRSSPVWGTAYIFHLCHMHDAVSTEHENVRVDSSTVPLPVAVGTDQEGPKTGENTEGVKPDEGRGCSVLPASLVKVLTDPDIFLVGVGIGGDVCRLEKEYEQLRACGGVKGIVDLSELAKRKVPPDRRRRGTWSLADLCGEMLGLELRKTNSLRTGTWEQRPLSVDQLFYAATDAYAGLRLWQVMHPMPDLVLQRSKGCANGGSVIHDRDAQAVATNTREESTCEIEDRARPAEEDVARGHANMVAKGYGLPRAFAPSSGPPLAAAKSRLSQAKLETHRLWHEDGLSVEAVADVRCNSTSTVLGYLADCVEAGLPYDWKRLKIEPNVEKDIVRALFESTQEPKALNTTPTQAGALSVGTDQGVGVVLDAMQTNTVGQLKSVGQERSGDPLAAATRWDSVRLSTVKELTSSVVEYWQIKMILARLRTGWSGHS